MVHSAGRRAAARGISPDIQLPEEKIVRTLDPVALRRIYDNILSNAVKYSAGGLVVSLLPDGTAAFSNSAPALSRVQAGACSTAFTPWRPPGTPPDWGCPSQGF